MNSAPERKYALTRLEKGDYLLPSNDGQRIWRISSYVESPLYELDQPKNMRWWGAWLYVKAGKPKNQDDLEWDWWELRVDRCDTRKQAINEALNYPT